MSDFKQISIVGFGLMGASLALALREKGFKGRIHGVDRDKQTIDEALEQHAIDGIGVAGSDLVILGVPVGQYDSILEQLAPDLSPDCLITDLGSVKGIAHKIVAKHLKPGQRFIGGHPMVGSEQSGFRHAKSHLYENAYFFLTASKEQSRDLNRLKQLIEISGAKCVEIEPSDHDEIVARTSHMPQICASTLVNLLSDHDERLADFVGGGFRDTTRIASSNPDLWTDILLNNKGEIVETIETFIQQLQQVKTALIDEDPKWLKEHFARAKSFRDEIPKHLPDSISKTFDIHIDVKDEPGVIAEPAALLSQANISIRDIEIVHAREHVPGVLKIGFYNEEDRLNAVEVIRASEYGKTNPVHLEGA